MPEEEVLERLQANHEGLSENDARDRLERFGRNTMEDGEGAGVLALILKQIKSPLIYLLAAAAGISLLTAHYVDAAVIMTVVILNTIIGTVQEWRAEDALEALHRMSAPVAGVIRDGGIREVKAEEVVPGDIIDVESGDSVAADARLLESEELQVNESALTGESTPVDKNPGRMDERAPLAERSNMLWMSTAVTSGHGRAVVVSTGMNTSMGEIAGQVRRTEREETPLQKRMGQLGKYLGIAAVALSLGLFGLGILRGIDIGEMALFAVAVAVSAIPEGLPAVISITLALGVQRMARQNAIIRRLPAVETLGSTTVICSDKTGTITRNEMTITRIWAGGTEYAATGGGYNPEGKVYPKEEQERAGELSPALRMLMMIGSLAGTARLVHDGDGWHVDGDPTEGAILTASRKAGLDPERLLNDHPRKAEIPFTSDRQYMATLHPAETGDGTILYVKGGPERILDFCTHMLESGERMEMDGSRRRRIEVMNESFANDALRVIAGAYREFPPGRENAEQSDAENGLTFAGLWGMADPPRPEAVDAIGRAKKAGIRVAMITGDHAATAAAVARKAGIDTDSAEVLTGEDIERMPQEELARRVKTASVFARVTPAHKVRIMEAFKANGHIVAVTGDGVNDAPALKGADIGIAMGKKGTEVAKEAADMVLTDDDFATIVAAVEEGRVIFSNLRRVIFFLIATSVSEILILGSALLVGLQLPLTPIMILWINLITDAPSDIPLGIEPKHGDVLDEPPRSPKASIINRSMIRRIALLSPITAAGVLGLFYYLLQTGDYPYARTVAFTTLAAFQWFLAFSARSHTESLFSVGLFRNRWLIFGIGAAILLQLLVVYWSPAQNIFETTGITLRDWTLILPVAFSLVLVDEIRKLIIRKTRPARPEREEREGTPQPLNRRESSGPEPGTKENTPEEEESATVGGEKRKS
ncbi:MAG: cation-translocating P-type ATPase [Candidatus Latescibacterota bacterium]